jgi:hypothetical protein
MWTPDGDSPSRPMNGLQVWSLKVARMVPSLKLLTLRTDARRQGGSILRGFCMEYSRARCSKCHAVYQTVFVFRDAELETVCPTSFVQTTPVWSAWEQSACAIGNFLHVLRDPASARALCFALLEVPCGGTHGCVGSRRWRARVMAIRAARGPLAHDRTIEQMAMYVLAGSISSRVARSDALW